MSWGGSNFYAPVQTVGQFLGLSPAPSVQDSTYSYEPGVVNCDLHDCLPPFVTSVLERALPYWGRRIRGFDDPAVCMTGVETRTSAPLRMGAQRGARFSDCRLDSTRWARVPAALVAS